MTIKINIRRLFAIQAWGKKLAEEQQDLRARNAARLQAAKGARK